MKRKQAKSKTPLRTDSKAQAIEHCFEGCLYFAVGRLYRTIDRMAVEGFKPMKIAPTHAYLITALNEFGEEGATPTELSNGMNLDPSTITRLISFLENKKWIQRKKLGRTTKLALTPKGRAQHSEIQKIFTSLYALFTQELGEKTIRDLTQLIDGTPKKT